MIDLSTIHKPKDGPAPRWFHVAVALSMILSAISALVATLHTGRTMTALVEQNARLVRANSTPLLEFGHGNRNDDGSSALSFALRNVGRGPARVVWFELRLDGKAMPDMTAALRSLHPNSPFVSTFSSGLAAPRLLAAGGEQSLFNWPQPKPQDAEAFAVWEALNRARFKTMEVEACYCSVFEECWTSRLNGDIPQAVAACKPEGHTVLKG